MIIEFESTYMCNNCQFYFDKGHILKDDNDAIFLCNQCFNNKLIISDFNGQENEESDEENSSSRINA